MRFFALKCKNFFVDRRNIYTSDKSPLKITVCREKMLLSLLLTSDTAIFYKIAEKLRHTVNKCCCHI